MDGNIPWKQMRNASVLVTGATGLVGSGLLKALAAADKAYGLNLRLLGHGRDTEKAKALRRRFGAQIILGDIREPIPAEALSPEIDYIFHCAAVTQSRVMAAFPAEVIETEVLGSMNILRLASGRHCKSMVYVSSMEVYGQTDLRSVTERDLGWLDLSDPRSAYPEAKRLCECTCAAHQQQYSLPIKIVRLAQSFGPGVAKDDGRVFAQFMRSAIAGEDIILHTQGTTVGNYCHIADAARGLITVLLKGENGAAYNVANPAASMTVIQMARLVAEDVCNGKIKVRVQEPGDVTRLGYAPTRAFTLNADKLFALGWRPKYGLADMYAHMLADWQSEQ